MTQNRIQNVGRDWLVSTVRGLTDHIEHITPSEYSERFRVLPLAVTNIPGPMRWSVNPYMREIVDCFDPNSSVREVNLKKGAQVTYTTCLESIMFYTICYLKTVAMIYITADKDLADARIEGNVLPMLIASGFDVFQSADTGNARKTGQTKKLLQWRGGGSMVPLGANSAGKMRQFVAPILLKDEIDGWPDEVGKDGCPDKLTDSRAKSYYPSRKIFRGSTPLIKGTSKIERQYRRGDQRKYMVCCLECGFKQELRWYGENKETGLIYGIKWDYDDQGALIPESVRYVCRECGHGHTEYDKTRLFDPEYGAEWVPTAKPSLPGIRSYHLSALYAPAGLQPWEACVADYLDAYDPITKQVKSIQKYQVFYNNVLGEPFEERGAKVKFETVSAHRRPEYRLGEVPQDHAIKYAGGPIRLIVLTADIHKAFIRVGVFGFTERKHRYLICCEEFRDESEQGCESRQSHVWEKLRRMIESTEYGGMIPAINLIDAGWAQPTVVDFCSQWEAGVYPIVGRDRPKQNARIIEFHEMKTRSGAYGYNVNVDHYKDMLAPILRTRWDYHTDGTQPDGHFNAPIDTPDKYLKELTVESKRKKETPEGAVSYYWHRPSNVRNELWDLLVYASAAIDIIAWEFCTVANGMDDVDLDFFWQNIE